MENIPITNYLYTAIISGYYTVDDCRKWADRIIFQQMKNSYLMQF